MAATKTQQMKTDRAISPWHGFRTGLWQKEINVRDFIQQNYEPYEGDESFLAPATKRTQKNLGAPQSTVRRGAAEGCARCISDPEFHHRSRPGLH